MADRRIWQLGVGPEVVAHVRWLRGKELVTDAPGPFGRSLESWLAQDLRKVDDDDVDPKRVRLFFEEKLPRRFDGLHARALVPREVPVAARWLVALDDDRIPRLGVRGPHAWANNRWPPDLDEGWLADQTASGAVLWARGSHGGFKAGGLAPDATEMWLTLAWCGHSYVLVPRQRRRMWCAALVERHRWWRPSPMRRIWRLLEKRL